LAKPAKRLKVGATVSFGDGRLTATVEEELEHGGRIVRFHYQGIFLEVLESLGEMPLPPYIHEKLADRERYQTVYAKENGSAAAPTAGLHFTQELLQKIEAKGVHLVYLTLHVGLGTFRPVSVDNLEDHESWPSERLLFGPLKRLATNLMETSKLIQAGPIFLSNQVMNGKSSMPFQPTSTFQNQLWSCWFLPLLAVN